MHDSTFGPTGSILGLSQAYSLPPLLPVSQARERAGGAGAVPLGTIAKCPSVASQSQTEIAQERRSAAVARRYDLQDCARSILPRERVASCGRLFVPGCDAVQVWYDPEHERAHFGQLVTCGSVWHCPVCAAKISERRRLEVAAAVQAWRDRGGLVALVTFTLSHHVGENLETVLGRLKMAREFSLSGRAAVDFKKEHGVLGSIRALEITYGKNGWHPHLHVLVFISPEINTSVADTDYFVREIKARWAASVDKIGGMSTWAYGCDVQICNGDVKPDSDRISDYITKLGSQWDETYELTKSNAKMGKRSGRSPMQLLSDANKGDDQAARLWLQYARVMKGQRFLYWSRGLRSLLGLVDVEQTDEDLANERVADAVLVVELARPAWLRVLANAARPDLLAAAAAGGYDAVVSLLVGLGVSGLDMPLCPGYVPPSLDL